MKRALPLFLIRSAGIETKTILALSAAMALAASAQTQIVSIGERSVPVVLGGTVPPPCSTGVVLKALSSYFEMSGDIGFFFPTSGVESSGGVLLRQCAPGVPSEETASNVEYRTVPEEAVFVGTNALSSIAAAYASSLSVSNAFERAEALLKLVSSGRVTNSTPALRAAFAVDMETPVPEDLVPELESDVAEYWSQLRIHPLSLLDWNTERISGSGESAPCIYFRYEDPSSHMQVQADPLVYIDGDWRIALFE